MTFSPVATLIASSPSRAETAASDNATRTWSGKSGNSATACFVTTRRVGTLLMAVPFLVGRLGGCPTPTTRQASGGGPPPQVQQDLGQPRLVGLGRERCKRLCVGVAAGCVRCSWAS